jgi:hypothetical protein
MKLNRKQYQKTALFFFLFIGLITFFYIGLLYMKGEAIWKNQYQKPIGDAQKVSKDDQKSAEWTNRLLFFYRDGE